MGIMSLGLAQGENVTVYADGVDERAAVEDIENISTPNRRMIVI